MSEPAHDGPRGDLDRELGLFEELAVKWPRLSVLRLHWVAGWALSANLVAWKAAGWFVGSTVAVQDSVTYMLLWLVLCLCMVVYWMHRQHRERPRLPPFRPLTLAWSPGMGSVLVAIMLSPTWTGVRAADERIRGLRSRQELQADMGVLGISFVKHGPAPTTLRTLPRAIAPKPPRVEKMVHFKGALAMVPGTAGPAKGVSDPSERSSNKTHAPSKLVIDVMARYVNRERMIEARACVDDTNECAAVWAGVRALTLDNVSTIAEAHGLPGANIPPRSEEYYGISSLAALAVVLGTMAGYLGVVGLNVIVRTSVALSALVLTMERFSPIASSAFHRTNEDVAHGWMWVSWGICGLMLAAVAVSIFRRRERDTWHDVGMLMVLLLPFFVVGSQAVFNFSMVQSRGAWHHFSMTDKFYLHIFATCGVVTLLGFVMTWPLSWYRTLPRST